MGFYADKTHIYAKKDGYETEYTKAFGRTSGTYRVLL